VGNHVTGQFSLELVAHSQPGRARTKKKKNSLPPNCYPTEMNFYLLILWDFISVGEKFLLFGQEMNISDTNSFVDEFRNQACLPTWFLFSYQIIRKIIRFQYIQKNSAVCFCQMNS